MLFRSPVSLEDNGGKLTFDKAGAYVLTATVTDKLGKEYAAALPLEVRPVIVLTLDAPETAHTGQPAAVRLSGTNLDVTWKVVSEDGAAVENNFTNGGGEITFDTAGTYTVTASVTDGLGRTFTASGTIARTRSPLVSTSPPAWNRSSKPVSWILLALLLIP